MTGKNTIYLHNNIITCIFDWLDKNLIKQSDYSPFCFHINIKGPSEEGPFTFANRLLTTLSGNLSFSLIDH